MFFVSVEASVEGLHSWPNAPAEERYLASPHRHLFVVRTELEVTHADRDIEINQLGRNVGGFLRTLGDAFPAALASGYDTHQLVHLGTMSCEDIAQKVCRQLRSLYGRERYVRCTVLEDGILGAGMELQAVPASALEPGTFLRRVPSDA